MNKIESNFSVPGILGYEENTLIKSFEMSPNLTFIFVRIKIPSGPASGSGLDLGWPWRDVGASLQTYQLGTCFEALKECVLKEPVDPRYTQIGFNSIFIQEWRVITLVLLNHILNFP